MSFFHTQTSAAITWVMIPLAAWAGTPSTGCVCANGHLKLFCQPMVGAKPVAGSASGASNCCTSNCCTSNCCSGEVADHETDCCGSGFCCHGAGSDTLGIGARSGCNPIVNAPSLAPKAAKVLCDQTTAIAAVLPEIGALARPSFAPDVAWFDTGPPLDRVIVFRSLLI